MPMQEELQIDPGLIGEIPSPDVKLMRKPSTTKNKGKLKININQFQNETKRQDLNTIREEYECLSTNQRVQESNQVNLDEKSHDSNLSFGTNHRLAQSQYEPTDADQFEQRQKTSSEKFKRTSESSTPKAKLESVEPTQ